MSALYLDFGPINNVAKNNGFEFCVSNNIAKITKKTNEHPFVGTLWTFTCNMKTHDTPDEVSECTFVVTAIPYGSNVTILLTEDILVGVKPCERTGSRDPYMDGEQHLSRA